MQVELTEQEIQTIISLLNVAVKAGGLQVAQAALPIAEKLSEEVKKAE